MLLAGDWLIVVPATAGIQRLLATILSIPYPLSLNTFNPINKQEESAHIVAYIMPVQFKTSTFSRGDAN